MVTKARNRRETDEPGTDEQGTDADAGQKKCGGLSAAAINHFFSDPTHSSSVTNSLSLFAIWALSRMMIEECIWLTRDSERSSVAPISFMVISS
jgi:hypothetical protein